MTFCSTDVTLGPVQPLNRMPQCRKQNQTKPYIRRVLRYKSQALRSQEMPWLYHSYLYDLIPFTVGVHTTKKQNIYTVIESTKIPILSPMAAPSFKTPYTPPGMWVWKWPNTLCIFLCAVCNDPQWTTWTNKQTLTVSLLSYFSISFVDILRAVTITYEQLLNV